VIGAAQASYGASIKPLFLRHLIILADFVHFLIVIYAERPYPFIQPESAAQAAEEPAPRIGKGGPEIGSPFGGK
jgi:hypothetical protein